jgi:hypothetical protein
MRQIFLRIALRSALTSVGIAKTAIPEIFGPANYKKPPPDTGVRHVVVEPGRIVVHDYSLEHRGSYHRWEPPSFESFVKSFVNSQIDYACTIYMATVRKDTLDKLRAGNHEEFFRVRGEVERNLKNRLEHFLNGWRFAFLRWGFQSALSRDRRGGA